jgi:hypothetical protein
MKLMPLLALGASAISLFVSPAFAKPPRPPNGHSNQSAGATGPTGAKGKAYGYYCQNQSKEQVAGQKGTPFSQCVTAMAKLASGKTNSPQAACASMSKTHTAGEKGTPFSRCVAAGAKLLKDHHK